MSAQEAERFLAFMKFPNIQDLKGYQDLLAANGCQVQVAEDTGRFAPYVDLYLDMLNKQLTYDALRIIGFDMALMQAHGGRDGVHAATGSCGQDRPGHLHCREEAMSVKRPARDTNCRAGLG